MDHDSTAFRIWAKALTFHPNGGGDVTVFARQWRTVAIDPSVDYWLMYCDDFLLHLLQTCLSLLGGGFIRLSISARLVSRNEMRK